MEKIYLFLEFSKINSDIQIVDGKRLNTVIFIATFEGRKCLRYLKGKKNCKFHGWLRRIGIAYQIYVFFPAMPWWNWFFLWLFDGILNFLCDCSIKMQIFFFSLDCLTNFIFSSSNHLLKFALYILHDSLPKCAFFSLWPFEEIILIISLLCTILYIQYLSKTFIQNGCGQMYSG